MDLLLSFRCKPLPLESYLRPKETEIAGSRPARVVQRGSGQKWKQGLEVASSALGKVPQLCFAICSLTFVFLVDPLEPKTPSPKMTCSIESVLQTFQAAVQKSMKFLREQGLSCLTDREHAILAVAVTELDQQGYEPFLESNRYVIQVETWKILEVLQLKLLCGCVTSQSSFCIAP